MAAVHVEDPGAGGRSELAAQRARVGHELGGARGAARALHHQHGLAAQHLTLASRDAVDPRLVRVVAAHRHAALKVGDGANLCEAVLAAERRAGAARHDAAQDLFLRARRRA
jgi:hypothetical protein